MDTAVFGDGGPVRVLIPGLGDGLRTAKGTAMAVGMQYRALGIGHTVYMPSRANELEDSMTTRQMADELYHGLIGQKTVSAEVIGVSQGGMIAQWLAADHPGFVTRLVLVVTAAYANQTVKERIGYWKHCAAEGNYTELFADTMEHMYTEKYLKKIRRFYPVLARFSAPKDARRFLIQADSCLYHDARSVLGQIQCPVLILGGEEDQVVGPDAAEELHQLIPGSRIHCYAGYGHGFYDEIKDWVQTVTSFDSGNI